MAAGSSFDPERQRVGTNMIATHGLVTVVAVVTMFVIANAASTI